MARAVAGDAEGGDGEGEGRGGAGEGGGGDGEVGAGEVGAGEGGGGARAERVLCLSNRRTRTFQVNSLFRVSAFVCSLTLHTHDKLLTDYSYS